MIILLTFIFVIDFITTWQEKPRAEIFGIEKPISKYLDAFHTNACSIQMYIIQNISNTKNSKIVGLYIVGCCMFIHANTRFQSKIYSIYANTRFQSKICSIQPYFSNLSSKVFCKRSSGWFFHYKCFIISFLNTFSRFSLWSTHFLSSVLT